MASSRSPASQRILAAVFSLGALLPATCGNAWAELLRFDYDHRVDDPIIRYWENTGELYVRGPRTAGATPPAMRSITIESAAGIFQGELASAPDGLRKASQYTIGRDFVDPHGSSGSFSFGTIASPMLSEEFLLADLTAQGSLTDGSEFGPADGARPTMLDYYPGIGADGTLNDQQLSIVYDAGNGNVSLDVPPGQELSSIFIRSDSSAPIFTECAISGSIDPCGDTSFFHATFGGTFSSLSFGPILEPGLPQEFLVNDLSVLGSTAGASAGSAFRQADFIYIPIPEPSSAGLLWFGLGAIGLVSFRCPWSWNEWTHGIGNENNRKKQSSNCQRPI